MSLLGLGYGLGGFMKGLNEQQNQQLLQQLSRLDLQRVQQQIQAQQQQDQAAKLLFPALLAGAGGQGAGQPSAPQFDGGPFGGGTGAPTPPAAAQPSSPPAPIGSGPTYGGIGDYGGGEPPGMGDYYAPARDQTDTGSGPNSITRQLTGLDPYAFLRDASPYSRFGSSQPLRLDAGGSFPAGPRGAARGANVTPSQPLSGLLPEFSPGGSGQYTYDSSGNLIDQVTGSPVSSVSSRAATPTTDIPPAATAPSSPPGFSGSSAAAQPSLSAGDDSDSGATYGRRLPLSLGTGADTSTYGGMSKADYLRQQAAKYPNIDPNQMMRTVMSEGGVGRFRLGDAGSSGGPFQLHIGGPRNPSLGDEFMAQTGKDPRLPQNEKAGIDWTLKYVSEQLGGRFPPGIWHGLRGSGGSGGGGGAGLGAGGGGGANDAILQQAMDMIRKGLAPVPESLYGRMSTQQLARQIENANPNADPVVKMLALERGMKLLAPEDRLATQQYMQEHQDLFRVGLALLQSQLTGERQRGQKEDQWDILTDPTTNQQYRYNKFTGQATTLTMEPYTPGGAQRLPGAGAGTTKLGHQANIIAFDKEGNQVFQGDAVYTPHGWVNTATGEPIPAAARVQETGRSGEGASGGRAGAQTSRQLVSGREIMSDLQNVVDMPITSDRGIFGGRKQGPSLTDALKEDLATTITGEDAQLINSALAGLERELSIVVSPVYGGHWAADTFNALSLKEGQTQLVKLYNLARMRQTVDNALESVENTDWVGAQQKKYAGYIREQLAKIVPWTPRDIIQFRSDPNDETFGSFVKKQGIGGAGGQPSAVPKVDANGNEIK